MRNPTRVQQHLDSFRNELMKTLSRPELKFNGLLEQDCLRLDKVVADEQNDYILMQKMWTEHNALLEMDASKVVLANPLLGCLFYAVSFTPGRAHIAEVLMAYLTTAEFQTKRQNKKADYWPRIDALVEKLFDLTALVDVENEDYVLREAVSDREFTACMQNFIRDYRYNHRLPKALNMMIASYLKSPYAINDGVKLNSIQQAHARKFYDRLVQDDDRDCVTAAGTFTFAEIELYPKVVQTFLGKFNELREARLTDESDLRKYELLCYGIANREGLIDEHNLVNNKIVSAIDLIHSGTALRLALLRHTKECKLMKPGKENSRFIVFCETLVNDAGYDDDRLAIVLKTERFSEQWSAHYVRRFNDMLAIWDKQQAVDDKSGFLHANDDDGVDVDVTEIAHLPLMDKAGMLKHLQDAFVQAARYWQHCAAIIDDTNLRYKFKTTKPDGNVDVQKCNLSEFRAKMFALGPVAHDKLRVSNVGLRHSVAYVDFSPEIAINLFDGFKYLGTTYAELAQLIERYEGRIQADDISFFQAKRIYVEKGKLYRSKSAFYHAVAARIKEYADSLVVDGPVSPNINGKVTKKQVEVRTDKKMEQASVPVSATDAQGTDESANGLTQQISRAAMLAEQVKQRVSAKPKEKSGEVKKPAVVQDQDTEARAAPPAPNPFRANRSVESRPSQFESLLDFMDFSAAAQPAAEQHGSGAPLAKPPISMPPPVPPRSTVNGTAAEAVTLPRTVRSQTVPLLPVGTSSSQTMVSSTALNSSEAEKIRVATVEATDAAKEKWEQFRDSDGVKKLGNSMKQGWGSFARASVGVFKKFQTDVVLGPAAIEDESKDWTVPPPDERDSTLVGTVSKNGGRKWG